MAHHQSVKKRIRQDQKKKVRNSYYSKTARNAIAKLRETDNKEEALKMYPKVVSMIDKLIKRGQVHKNKAANLKSKLMKHVNSIGAVAE